MGQATYRLSPDAYVQWSTVVDAPISPVLTRDQVAADLRARRPSEADEVLARLDTNGHSWKDMPAKTPLELVAFNRAGPQECCLTPEAIIRFYRGDVGLDTLELTPADILPYSNCDADDLAKYPRDQVPTYWIPWAPGNAPAEITPDTDLHARVRTNIPT